MSSELVGLRAGEGSSLPGTDRRSCPVVAGGVFPRASEARPQRGARGAEEGRERRGELGRPVGGCWTWDAREAPLCSGGCVLVPGKTQPAYCQEGQLPVGVLGVSSSSTGLLLSCELSV